MALTLYRALLFTGALSLVLSLAGCGVSEAAENIKQKVEKEWGKIEESPEIRQLTDHTRDAFRHLEKSTKAGAGAVEKAAEDAMMTAVRELYAAWKVAMKPLNQGYVITPKCLLAMAVGGGAIPAASGLGLAALGFASEGVEAGSLAALWQSALGDVEAGSVFSRLQSLGAKGLSTAHAFEVKGVLATISAGVCGVVNSLCHNCLSSSGLYVGGPTSSHDNFTLQDNESMRVTKSQPDLSHNVHQSSDEDNSTELFF